MKLSKAVIEKLVSRTFKDTGVDSISILHGGEASDVYKISCSHPQKTFVLKIFPQKRRQAMEKEVYLYKLLESRKDIPTPHIIDYGTSMEKTKRSWILMDYVKGVTISGNREEILDKEAHDIFFQVGKIVNAINDVKFDKFGYISKGIQRPYETNIDYIDSEFNKMVRKFVKLGGPKKFASGIKNYMKNNSEFLKCDKASLCHNDLHMGNIVIRKNGGWKVVGIFDIENAVAADPILDVARTHYFCIKDNKNWEDGFLKGYGNPPNNWKKKLEIYTLYQQLSLWIWLMENGPKSRADVVKRDMERLLHFK